MSEFIGCCSSYVECSDALRCIHEADPEYAGCSYRKNLERGRVFYGKNAFREDLLQVPEQDIPAEKEKETEPARAEEIYLSCYNRLFAIRYRHRNTYSYKLQQEQVEAIRQYFDMVSIPYKTEKRSDECIIEGPTEGDPFPANSRAVMTVGDQEYHILNFNGYLIKKYYADKISKALGNKNIKSRVEVVGVNAPVRNIPTASAAPAAPVKPKQVEKPKKVIYEQLSLFDIA
ncbi:hypothetical protein [Petroclostridium sp. X23]|uniref:hypothetical protein n=1 Tax=Petroclostridium sp. X23 TaxID=3045146 RepID=UPI0024ADC733|nr:hypothetical protein [Petroclostridium sp. X23]WHH58292.1 hypothetical protein QKW49_21210 [Petroclostridium sp. X23]